MSKLVSHTGYFIYECTCTSTLIEIERFLGMKLYRFSVFDSVPQKIEFWNDLETLQFTILGLLGVL